MNEIIALLTRARENIRIAELLIQENSPDIAEALLLYRGLSFSSHSAVIAAYGKEFARYANLTLNSIGT